MNRQMSKPGRYFLRNLKTRLQKMHVTAHILYSKRGHGNIST